jgi:hypothetical protein
MGLNYAKMVVVDSRPRLNPETLFQFRHHSIIVIENRAFSSPRTQLSFLRVEAQLWQACTFASRRSSG